MKKILIIWSLISVLLVGGLTYLGFNLQNKNKNYYKLEERLKTSAEDYYSQYPNELPANKKAITVPRLIETSFLMEFKNQNEDCKGYVVIKKNLLSHDYKPYIKCSNYETKGYDSTNEGE